MSKYGPKNCVLKEDCYLCTYYLNIAQFLNNENY